MEIWKTVLDLKKTDKSSELVVHDWKIKWDFRGAALTPSGTFVVKSPTKDSIRTLKELKAVLLRTFPAGSQSVSLVAEPVSDSETQDETLVLVSFEAAHSYILTSYNDVNSKYIDVYAKYIDLKDKYKKLKEDFLQLKELEKEPDIDQVQQAVMESLTKTMETLKKRRRSIE